MKKLFLLMLFVILPLIVNSQTAQQDFNRNMKRYDNDWAARTRMNHMGNKTTATDSKIFSEEKNKKKLEEKTTKLNSDLKSQQDKLAALQNSGNSTDNDTQKDIEKAKEQISKTEEKLSKAKSELETSSKKVEDLKKEKEISLTRQVDLEKKEKEDNERKQKQEEINQSLLKSLKSN